MDEQPTVRDESTPGFTPGPWRIGSLASYDGYTGKPYRNVWADDPDTGEAVVVARCIDNGNCDEDARLIASARELYAACRAFAAKYGELYHDMDADYAAFFTAFHQELRLAESAIAKAEGRS